MYTQEIVCPHCGKPAIVIVLDSNGNTTSPCQKCNKKIQVISDSSGKIKNVIALSDCLIVTTCLRSQGTLPDVDKEAILSTIRHYRDSYLKGSPNGDKLLEEYYSIAPRIVASILSRGDPDKALREIYDVHITPAAAMIANGRHEEVLNLYESVMRSLVEEYLPNASFGMGRLT